MSGAQQALDGQDSIVLSFVHSSEELLRAGVELLSQSMRQASTREVA